MTHAPRLVPFLFGIIFGGAGTFLVVFAFFHAAIGSK